MILSFLIRDKSILQDISKLFKTKIMKKIFIPIIILIGISISAFAQEKSRKEKKGDKYFFTYSFDKAIDSYSRSKTLTLQGQHRLAESYQNIDLNAKSEEVYLQLISNPGSAVPEDYYNYAMIQKINGKYDESDKWMDKFAQLKPNDLRAKDYLANKKELTNWLKDAGNYKIEHLNINSSTLDFGTNYYKDNIVFASTRATPKMIKRYYNWTRQPYWDMYVSEVSGQQLNKPVKFDKQFSKRLHDGPASFSKDGNFMAYTRNNYNHKGKDKVVELQIYFSSFKEGKWSAPESFILNNEDYSVGHPCLSAGGDTMYYTSDKPGGYGGTDLYITTKDINGVWGKNENLGDKINTEGDEMFPFYQGSNKTLYFSSNGRFGLGGLDIFIAEVKGTGFGPAINAGYPLNTQYDDYAFIVNNTKGYFSSNRTGGSGGDDIYSVSLVNKVEDVEFLVNAPENIPVERRVRETFPLRNYIFFNKGSTQIPDRYVLLRKDQVKDFKEDQLEVFTPKTNSGRANRQMIVYYNVINILGDRMGKNPNSTIKLVGSSENGPDDGKEMSESVKGYLVSVFGIDATRIRTEGRDKPNIPSEQPGGILELKLLREGDQRVSVESGSPALLMEFQSGPDAPLKPVEIITVQEAPLDSYVTFNVKGGNEVLSSWNLELMDEKGKVQNFGPYTQELISIPGKSILGVRPMGDYKVKMTGQTKTGKIIKKETSVHMVLWTPPESEEMMRFSIIYEFNDSRSIAIYDKYLTEIVIPKIPKGAKLIIHGHTDIIGDAAHNQDLSVARANDVKEIFRKGLASAGRSDVKYEVFGFGENENDSPFENKFPEERFYNRTVIIDIIPQQ